MRDSARGASMRLRGGRSQGGENLWERHAGEDRPPGCHMGGSLMASPGDETAGHDVGCHAVAADGDGRSSMVGLVTVNHPKVIAFPQVRRSNVLESADKRRSLEKASRWRRPTAGM